MVDKATAIAKASVNATAIAKASVNATASATAMETTTASALAMSAEANASENILSYSHSHLIMCMAETTTRATARDTPSTSLI